jgi:hypothetical protein
MTSTDTFSTDDALFFRIVQSLFPPSFTFGAGVLLASYDEDGLPYLPAEQVPAGTLSPVRV